MGHRFRASRLRTHRGPGSARAFLVVMGGGEARIATDRTHLDFMVETGGYNLSSVYRQPTRNQSEIPTIATYRAVNHVRVRADDLDWVGGLIDVAITAGRTGRAGRARQRHHPVPVADTVTLSPGVLPA